MKKEREFDCRNDEKSKCKGFCDTCIHNGDIIPVFRFLLFIWLWKIGKQRRLEIVKQQRRVMLH
ncbi:MAG: hypothetical protein EAX96_20820 [Candidatus Lokiarchaeota archaeon]|nr:hypothetical protein [Candidatus Lokiarchaeota archaeon]